MTARGIEAIKLNTQTKVSKLSADVKVETQQCNTIEILNDKDTKTTTMSPIERYRWMTAYKAYIYITDKKLL